MYEIGMRVEVTLQDENGQDEVVRGVLVPPFMQFGAWIRLVDGDVVLSDQEFIHVI